MTNNNWKQPIPTNLKELFGNDYLGMNLYIWLLINSANKDGMFMDQRGKSILVKRGQTIFGRNEYAKLLNCSPKTAERTLSRICLKVVLKMTKQANKNFTVVSINNYDEVTSMTQQRPSNDQAMTTSKSVKNREREINKERDNPNPLGEYTNVSNQLMDKYPSDNRKRVGTKPSPPLSSAAPLSLYIAAFNKQFGTQYTLTNGRKIKLAQRLKNFKLDQILQALENMASDKFFRGENDRGWRADPDYLIRNDEQIDRFLNKKPVSNSSWTL